MCRSWNVLSGCRSCNAYKPAIANFCSVYSVQRTLTSLTAARTLLRSLLRDNYGRVGRFSVNTVALCGLVIGMLMASTLDLSHLHRLDPIAQLMQSGSSVMRAQAFLQILALLHLSTSACAQNVSNVLNPSTEAFINNVLAEWNSPGGFAVAVVRRDASGSWQVETKGYGTATLDGRKMTEKTRFSIASNSKLFTVLATGLLIHNETISPRLSWTSKIASLIPDWSLTDPVALKQLTISDAMSHRSGLPRHDFSYKLTDDAADVVEKLRHLRPSAEFRDVWQYSNMMYVLLSTLSERVLPSKTPFIQYVQQHILEPLGMNATTYSYPAANATGEFADGLTRQGINVTDDPFGNGTAIRRVPFFTLGAPDTTFIAGAGGITSNAVDLATWLKMLLLNGAHPDTNATVIPADVVDKAATGISVWSGQAQFPELSPVVYGGGQGRGTYRGHDLIEHGGDVQGHHSQVTRLPNDGLGVMVYSNDETYGPVTLEIIKYRLIDEALGLEPVDWNTRYKALVPQLIGSAPAPTPRPANATLPSAGLSALTGMYKNAGYGSFELCLVSDPPAASASAKCKTLAADAPRILPGAVTPGVPTFLAEWNSPWGSHVRLSHFTGNTFNLSLLSSFPTGNASEPFWTSDGTGSVMATAQFDAGGVGLAGIWGAGDGVPEPIGMTVRERAEVWFDRT
ncbi:putative beta-lactamase [Lyophyllum shimeji]|uniref:Beta-lactamase n=1 Tax=Lyophyllum shimeji TaxID=47721 RepID=A0A9P3URH3_LYOSH|nr:putative beta-lactamase [Lyophyllum shimeji]